MSKKPKTLCEWKKSQYTAELLVNIIQEPRFFCENCGRAANKKKYLCEPQKLDKSQTS